MPDQAGRETTHPGFTWTKPDGAGLVVPPHAAADCTTPAGCEVGRQATAGGDPTVNQHLWVQTACTCKTAQMENPDCEVHGGDED